jgi:hypothetical protein
MGAGWANAVSVGSNPLIITPHGLPTALAGIIEGAKKSIAAINIVLTAFLMFIVRTQ